MIRWFCNFLWQPASTVDDVLDHYPVDRLMHDVALAPAAVQTQTTGASMISQARMSQTQSEPGLTLYEFVRP